MGESSDFSRIVNTTIANYIRDVEVDILRNRKLTALLEAAGRYSTGWAGDECIWPIRYRRAVPRGFGLGDTLDFSQKDRIKKAKLGWRGFAVGDSISKMEKEQNKSINALVNTFSEMSDNLLDDMKEHFCDLFYLDGNAAANSKLPHGIESFLGNAGTYTLSGGAYAKSGSPLGPGGSALAASDLVIQSNDSYAGMQTQPGYYGGSWTGTWPSGSGPAHYDFYSPVEVVTDSTGWVGSGHIGWNETCEKALRRGIMWSQRNKSADGRLNMILLEQDMFYSLQNAYSAKQVIQVQRNEPVSLVALGFTDVLNIDGVEVTWEYGMPIGTGYGFNVQQMGVRSLQEQVFVPEGPDYDMASKVWRFSVDFLGNFWFRPRYVAKWFPYYTGTIGA